VNCNNTTVLLNQVVSHLTLI